MTEKDREIQELKRRLREAEEQLGLMIEVYRACGFCKWLDSDCSPTDDSCHPEWSHKKSIY